MKLPQAEQAITNGIYAAVAWLLLDFGFLVQEHGGQTLSFLVSRPEMAAGAIIVLVCIAGLFKKSRIAAAILFLLFLLPMILRIVNGALPSTMFLIFSLILLYFFLTAILGTFSYHQLKTQEQDTIKPD